MIHAPNPTDPTDPTNPTNPTDPTDTNDLNDLTAVFVIAGTRGWYEMPSVEEILASPILNIYHNDTRPLNLVLNSYFAQSSIISLKKLGKRLTNDQRMYSGFKRGIIVYANIPEYQELIAITPLVADICKCIILYLVVEFNFFADVNLNSFFYYSFSDDPYTTFPFQGLEAASSGYECSPLIRATLESFAQNRLALTVPPRELQRVGNYARSTFRQRLYNDFLTQARRWISIQNYAKALSDSGKSLEKDAYQMTPSIMKKWRKLCFHRAKYILDMMMTETDG